jgi:hypothetical protein
VGRRGIILWLTISKPVCPIFDNAPRENKNDKQRSSGTQEGASRRQSERLHDSEILTTEDITRSDETVADQGRFALWLGRELPCAGEISAPFDRPPSPVPARSQPQTVHRSVADTEGLNGSVTASPAPRHRSPGRSAILAPHQGRENRDAVSQLLSTRKGRRTAAADALLWLRGARQRSFASVLAPERPNVLLDRRGAKNPASFGPAKNPRVLVKPEMQFASKS